MARVDAAAKVAGEMLYTADVDLPGLCHAALVHSPFPHARIVRVDAAEALALPGVIGVYTAADLPEGTLGRRVRDTPVLARSAARFAGERVAVVLAESRIQAERAAARVHVDYEQLPAVLDAEEALRPGAPAVHEAPWTYPGAVIHQEDGHNLQAVTRHSTGDVEAGLAGAAWTVERTYSTPEGHQGYIEPHACVGSADPDGRLHLWMANKSPYGIRVELGGFFGVRPEDIVVHPVAIGGDFGGKGASADPALCLSLARLAGRPVKLVLRYAEDLMSTNPRHASRIRVRLGCDREGHLVALDFSAVFTGGAYAGFKPGQSDLRGVLGSGSSYRIPNLRVLSRLAYTNTVPSGFLRAPGASQTVFAVESAMDELAREAGIDPVELRRRNLLRTGDTNPYGNRWVEARGVETLDAALAAHRPLPAPPGWLYGCGMALYDRATHAGETSMRLRAEPDGGVTAFIPFPETGTGSHTVVRQLVARALGLPPEKVAVRQVDTSELPRDAGVGGSRVTTGITGVVDRAAAAWGQRGEQSEITVQLERGEAPALTSFCVQIAQVAVDPGTGQVRVMEILAACDVADVVNPLAHQNQIDGGMAMGFGFACTEDLELSDRVTAANLGDFKLPSARDVPVYRTVLLPGGRGLGEANVKGIGELTNVPTAAAIANALAAATGTRVRDLPLTAERVFGALEGSREGAA